MDLAEANNLDAAGMAGPPAKSRAPLRRHEHERGYVLHTYPYSETSLIVETYTREHGRVPMVAKGAKRSGSALRGALMQFQPVAFSWTGKNDLRSLTQAEWLGGLPGLSGDALFCGFYLNELLLKLLARDDAHERLFDCYEDALRGLADQKSGRDEATVLRGFERELLREIGYALNLTHEAGEGAAIVAEGRYVYHPERGARRLEAHEHPEIEISGRTLLDLDSGTYSSAQTATQAKLLMRQLLNHQLNGRALATRQIFTELQQL
ncbi:MAG TPA: DNA repair protein RecO [Burkholderiales bacterium]|nr:DNA repair protein RecO [Burkholderiales bacterium]